MHREDRLDDLLSIPILSAPLVSPDGSWVAWSWSRLGPATDVFAAPVDGSSAPLRLTETAEGDTAAVSWTTDGASVLVAQDNDGDERVRLFRVRLSAPGELEPLTEAGPNYYIRSGQLHPNGRWLVYAANLDPETAEEIEQGCIYRHDLETGERRRLVFPERNAGPPALNRQGTSILYPRNDLDAAGEQVWMVDIEGGLDREILNFGARAKVNASWMHDGRRVLFVAETGSHRGLGVWDEGSVRWLVDDPERDVDFAFVPPGGGPAVVVETRDARVLASLLDVEDGTPTPLGLATGNLVPLAPVEDDGWLCLHYDARHPVDLVRYRGESDTPSSVTGLPEKTTAVTRHLVAAEDFRWQSVDGLGVQGWLYRTEQAESEGAVVLIHGGPTSHAEDRFNAEIQYLLSCGFDVLAPNYRGSTGFGLPFQESIKEDGWGGREQADIRYGIEALLERGIARPGRVGVTGTSYGGYSAWWAITHFGPEIVAASVPICGMTDLVVDYYATRPDLRPYSEEMMGGTPEDVPKIYRERSPLESVGNIRGKLLIVQGLKDPNVTPDNVHAVVEALQKKGIPYELLTFEDEGHGIGRPKNLRVLYPRLANFFHEAFSASP